MAVLKTRCPECNAGLKSPTGFAVGQSVCCPKCETYFAVEEPEEEIEEPKKAPVTKGKPPAAKKPVRAVAEPEDEEDDEDDAPKQKKKKKKRRDDDEDEDGGGRSYKNSPIRFVILGVLIVIMLVLGYFLYEKRKREREDAGGSSSAGGGGTSTDPNPPNPGPRPAPGPGPGPRPPGGKQPNPGPAGGAVAGGGLPNLPFIGGGPALSPDEFKRHTDAFKAQLIGTWVADLGGGVTEEITYTATGTFSAKLTGPTASTVSGKYTIVGLTGNNPYTGLRIRIEAPGATRAVTAIFDGDDIEHTSLQPGVTGIFRKKS